MSDTTKIDPKKLRQAMDAQRLTASKLAERSGVSSKTITRFLNPPEGRGKRPRGETVYALANALDVLPDAIMEPQRRPRGTADKHNADAAGSTEGASKIDQSQLNIRVDAKARNAATIIAKRYGITIKQMFMLAPVLFLHAAEESLARRQEQLDAIETHEREIWASSENLSHLTPLVRSNPYAQNIAPNERASITSRDIFAKEIIRFKDAEIGSEELYEDPESENPFSTYLKSVLEKYQDYITFNGFSDETSFTRYELSESVIRSHFDNGDQCTDQAIRDVKAGHIGLYEVPNNVDMIGWINNESRVRGENSKAPLDPETLERRFKLLGLDIRKPDHKAEEHSHD